MSVISISITKSDTEVVSGIPKMVYLEANIPCTIFYTINGKDPDYDSQIYTGPILITTYEPTVILKIFATNGTDTSPVIVETYETNILNNTRLQHPMTDSPTGENFPSRYPFGMNDIPLNSKYINPGDTGLTVDNPELNQIPSGFDADQNPTGFTNEEYNLENYIIKYSTTDDQGRTGVGIGTLPAKATTIPKNQPPSQTEQYKSTFDPRASVIFQDVSKENPLDPPNINRDFFSMQNHETYSDGNNFYSTASDSQSVSGSFIRSHYNPRDNTLTSYFFDSSVNKWIISTAPYESHGTFDGNMVGIYSNRTPGSKYVIPWIPFARRVLF